MSVASFQPVPIFSHTTTYLPATSFGFAPLVLRLKVPISRAAEGPSGFMSTVVSFGSADPKHERHRELKEWFADDFNPDVVDVDWLSEDVAALAERWSRQPTAKRRRTA
jgi:hypothetical protein